MFSKWYKSGEPFIWLNAGATAISLIMVFGLILLIAGRGMVHFWPAAIHQFEVTQNGQTRLYAGQLHDIETVSTNRLKNAGLKVPEGIDGDVEQFLYKIGNRRTYGNDFVWIPDFQIGNKSNPQDLIVIERTEWGNFYGRLENVNGSEDYGSVSQRNALSAAIERARKLRDEIREIEKNRIGSINFKLEKLRLQQRKLELNGRFDESSANQLQFQREALQKEFEFYGESLASLDELLRRDTAKVRTADGIELDISLADIVDAYYPNAMTKVESSAHYAGKIWEFLSTDPREANTEGGVFPAIFGTVAMVFIMAILVTPLGVIAAIYLREYATQGYVTRLIRVAINNLAGVPSIVYGVFGLGFFVYFLGGSIDKLFYPESLPAPTFGTPGLMWAALTLALLTLPVVIVATEEGLSRIPDSIREGCLALGATRAETLWRVIIPMSSPAIMTGLILAIARAAGEVAPLMMVGVVKLAPTLAVDGNAPYLHLDRKFMHLGFHIYDVGFQSPNVEAARPLVYATALLLVLVILLLNLSAITLRNHLRERYKMLEN